MNAGECQSEKATSCWKPLSRIEGSSTRARKPPGHSRATFSRGRFRASKAAQSRRGEAKVDASPRTPSCLYEVRKAAAYAWRLWFELFCQGCFHIFLQHAGVERSGELYSETYGCTPPVPSGIYTTSGSSRCHIECFRLFSGQSCSWKTALLSVMLSWPIQSLKSPHSLTNFMSAS